jgi:hypothetical protein
MKVKFEIPANGYKADMIQAREDNVFPEWVDRKIGDRIRDLISEDFMFDIQTQNEKYNQHFIIIDFTYEDDAFAFLKLFGGRAYEN